MLRDSVFILFLIGATFIFLITFRSFALSFVQVFMNWCHMYYYFVFGLIHTFTGWDYNMFALITLRLFCILMSFMKWSKVGPDQYGIFGAYADTNIKE